MPIHQILEPVPNPEDGTDIEKDAPRKFTNIDSEPFEFTWDGKPFGGIFPERMKSREVSYDEKIIDEKGFPKMEQGSRIIFEFVRPIEAGETVTMPKYLVNYAAYHLARKMYKREAFKAFQGTEQEKKNASIRFVNPEEQIKLMKKMVSANFPDQQVEEAKMPDAKTVIDQTQVDKKPEPQNKVEGPEGGFKCSDCNFAAKSEFGLLSHKRKHQKK